MGSGTKNVAAATHGLTGRSAENGMGQRSELKSAPGL
jgi:hypothetical protein